MGSHPEFELPNAKRELFTARRPGLVRRRLVDPAKAPPRCCVSGPCRTAKRGTSLMSLFRQAHRFQRYQRATLLGPGPWCRRGLAEEWAKLGLERPRPEVGAAGSLGHRSRWALNHSATTSAPLARSGLAFQSNARKVLCRPKRAGSFPSPIPSPPCPPTPVHGWCASAPRPKPSGTRDIAGPTANTLQSTPGDRRSWPAGPAVLPGPVVSTPCKDASCAAP